MKVPVPATLIAAAIAMQCTSAYAQLHCTILADAATGTELVREGQYEQRVTPASTFKIAISLMGYDSGILDDEHSPSLPFKQGYLDWQPTWRASTDPAAWMKNSVVWYSEQVVFKLGAARFQRYADGFDYGNHDLSARPRRDDGHVLPWLSSSLKISPVEQVAFLTKLVTGKLPVTKKAVEMTSRLLTQPQLANGWNVYGKTGTGGPDATGATTQGGDYGWFVGWATRGEQRIVFARLVQDDRDEKVRAGLRVRDALLRELPALLDAASAAR